MDEAILEFTAEAREGLEALDAALVAFERAPDDPALLGDIFRVAHSLKGASGFLGLVRLQSLTHAMENVLGAFRDGDLPVTPDAVSLVLEALDRVKAMVEILDREGAEPAGDDRDMIVRLDAAFSGAGTEAALVQAKSAGDKVAPASGAPLLNRLGGEATLDAAVELGCDRALSGRVELSDEDMERLRAGLRSALTEAARGAGTLSAFDAELDARLAAAPEEVRAAVRPAVVAGLIELEAEAVAVNELFPTPTPDQVEGKPAPLAPSDAAAARTIRVGVDTLEHLMASASELVLIRNQLIQALRDQPDSPFAAPLHRLNQVTSELQEGVMATRMQPIQAAWAKLPRLTRDLAAELGKSIDLRLTGQDTELDRQVMELIKDPLNHLIRNAADHGLEKPEERRAAGKPETGRLILAARHESGAIVIELSDDGRGLNLDRIREKAVASGLVTAAEAAVMDAGQTARLIFAPGFSTAAEVSAVSGRGVGMDVVRANIERIGGTVDLHSTPGRGTRVVIRIPMTLSIVSALIVECGGERFALPQSAIVELVGAGAGGEGRRVETVDGVAVLRLRDRLLPLADLRQTLRLEAAAPDGSDACIVVTRVGGFTFGVVVDRVFDTEEIVVKPLAGPLRRLRLYSGATILGDGAVVMILDAKGLAEGLGAGELAETAAAVLDTAAHEETGQTLLLFRVGEDQVWGAPLARVARLEEVAPDRVERLDGRIVTQYHDRLMPLVTVEGAPATNVDQARPLLVFADGERLVGVPADEIVDIARAETVQDLPAVTAGVAGSAIVAGRAVSLLDVDGLWRAQEGPAPASVASAAEGVATDAGGGETQRPTLLVVDDSPFTQMMIRPILMRAGYAVEVAATPEAALALHESGRVFDLILVDTNTSGPEARRLAEALSRARRWRDTPLLGLGAHGFAGRRGEGGGEGLLSDVDESLKGRAA